MSALQAQRRVQDLVFGPYDSRRFGRSLGVNPLPRGSRLCNFDCVYCECGSGSWPLEWELRPQFPTPENIHDALVSAAGQPELRDLDALTIAGNGEPALSPYLDEVVDVVVQARDRDWPEARTLILTNGTLCHKPAVRKALAKLDERIIKLDAGTNWALEQINRPAGKLNVHELLRRISLLPDIIVQSMFVEGPAANTGTEELNAWAGWIAELKPLSVQVYSLDRVPAKDWVRKVSVEKLQQIADYVHEVTGVAAHTY